MARVMWRSSLGSAAQIIDQIGMALVVGEINALFSLGRASVPARLGTGEEADQAQQKVTHQLGKHGGDDTERMCLLRGLAYL